MAAAVASTSSPSSNPSITDSPTASADSISARCEIDLSPGTVIVPRSGPDAEKERGVAILCGFDSRALLWQWRAPYVAVVLRHRVTHMIFRSIETRW